MKPQPKIIIHGRGTGDLNDDDVERRAREIARIEGRAAVTERDRAQAWAELDGQFVPGTVDSDGQSIGSLHRDPSEPVGDPGRRVANQDDETDATAVERLANEGVEEAQHDQMLAARDREHRSKRR